MAPTVTSWSDYFSGFFSLAILIGVVYVGYLIQQGIQNGVAGAKQQMKAKGLTMDEHGMSVKTDRRAPSKEEYVQNQANAMLASSKRLASSGAVSFGKSSGAQGEPSYSEAVKRKGSK